jgi:phosphatidylinositol-3-phosphatase
MTTIRFARLTSLFSLGVFLFLFAGCGTSRSTPSASPTSTTTPSSSVLPSVQHVAVIMLENQSYSTVISSGSMPYLNSLTKQGALATNYFASAHPSLPNYFALTTGQTLVSADASPVQDVNNIVRVLAGSGKSWKGYFQSLPSTGYMGLDVPPYVKHHNPFAYFSDVVNSTAQQQHVVNLTQLGVDAGANTLPNFLFIVPDDLHSGGECPDGTTSCANSTKVAVADAWLQSTVNTLMSSTAFQQSGVVVITFDEAAESDTTNGGGHIATVIVGSHVKAGFQSSTTFQHPSVLRFALQALGASNFPGSAASAAGMAEFFQ